MTMQISVDPASLSKEQREAVAGFILAYPNKTQATLGIEVKVDTTKAVKAIDDLAAHATEAVANEIGVELTQLQHDHESTMPEVAFASELTPAAAFGVPAAPLERSTPTIQALSTDAPQPPANTAPITTTPGVASSAAGASSAGVELDKHGLPWDGRIHAESKGKLTDGSWRKKRQVDPALVAQVEAELRQVMGAAPAAPLAPAAAIPAQPPAPVAGAAPTMPAAPNVAPAGEVPQDARQQFVGLVGRAAAAIQAQKVTQAEINQCCLDVGVPALPMLANRLDLVAQVAANIDALIMGRGQ